MATIAIGDLHGDLTALADLLARIQPELGTDDTVVFLGDYIDNGPDTRGCVDAILSFRDVHPRTVCLQGNHEVWMLRTRADHTRHSWLIGMDAFATIRSYSSEAERVIQAALAAAGRQLLTRGLALPYDALFDAMPATHHQFFDQLALSFQNGDGVFTHAGIDPGIARLADQPRESLQWGHPQFPQDYAGEAPLVYGHWNNAEVDEAGRPHPRIIGRTIGIDTIAHGVLTAIRLPDRRVFQSAVSPPTEP